MGTDSYLVVDVDVTQPRGDVGFALSKLADTVGNNLPVNVKKWMSNRMFGIGQELLRSIRRRFDTQTDALGFPWAPLKEVTVDIKQWAGVSEPERILVWTGTLRKSFKYKYTTDYTTARVWVYTDIKYAWVHDQGGPASWPGFSVPPRPFGGIDEQAQVYINAFIRKWVAALLKEELTP
jgi:phage gpG-like protein